MNEIYKTSLFTIVAAGLAVGSVTIVKAQSPVPGTGASMTKQEQKAQRKAERKARRAKKNAELDRLEKNGYDPARGSVDYPENLMNAEKKSRQQKGVPAGPEASAP